MDTILTPVLVLIIWTLLIWVWMYATRIPAMNKAGIKPNDARSTNVLASLPQNVRQVADNYNHLMEQPTIFYALVFFTYLAGHESDTTVMLAWAYVASRIVHSLIQCTINVVTIRFAVFTLGTLVLAAWSVIEAMAVCAEL